MKSSAHRAVAIVGVGAVMPDAPNAPDFWQNIKQGRYSVSDVPANRWDWNMYYDADPKAPDKTYSKIGGWVKSFDWDPLRWKLPIPPRVGALMDPTQKWAVAASREALQDYGFPGRPLNLERTAVILGNAMAGDQHLFSATRILFPEYADELLKAPSFAALQPGLQQAIIEEMRAGVWRRLPEITEDTMPGELANIIAGRIASLYDFKGPNYVADAACASAMAGMSAALEGLTQHDYDAVVTGGIDANMCPSTFVKFCKIGALSATGTRPYAEGADGFVMGEGAAIFVLKRLEDAEQDGDKIYAVIRALGGSSDGKGKSITAPNPVGQKLAVRRAWDKAGLVPAAGDMIEGHGTSTRVGDVAEVESLIEAFSGYGLPVGSIALGSVKSNIGHLKGAAGAAGILKATLALHEKVLPPSLNFARPNPGIDFERSPFRVNTQLRPWEAGKHGVRRCGVSAFGFGGTNFHAVLEEYIPGRLQAEVRATVSVSAAIPGTSPKVIAKTPLRGALVLGGKSEAEIAGRLKQALEDARNGRAAPPAAPSESELRAPVRLAIDYGDAAELADKAARALKALEESQAGRWKALRAKGIFLGHGPAPKVAFLFSGQGAQYVNMLRELRQTEPVVRDTFDEADQVMAPLLGKPLSQCIYLDESDEAALAAAEQGLKQTAITQPAVLATETALARLLGTYGITPDMVIGHSLGEYGALVAAGCLPFADALRAVSARGQEMTRCALGDNGVMAAVSGPIEKIEEVLAGIDGYVVIANINSTKENVIGGSTPAVQKAMEALREAGLRAQQLQVSHAFHTSIVAPAGENLVKVLQGIPFQPPSLPIISNVTGDFYPMGPGVAPRMIEMLGRQVASPVQFVKGLKTLYAAGVRVFVEVGPKRILYGFVEDVLGESDGVWPLFTNHPRIGEAASINLALCGLYAAGLGVGAAPRDLPKEAPQPAVAAPAPAPPAPAVPLGAPLPAAAAPLAAGRYVQLGRLFADFLDRSFQVYAGGRQGIEPVRIGITGAALGLPAVEGVFDDSNVARILRGDQFIGPVPMHLRQAMIDKNIHRLIKTASGEGRFETISDASEAIKLAARGRGLNMVRDFGFPEDRLLALDHVTRLAIAAGIDALRDAGIPLVMRYKTTTKGTKLPERWMLPEEMRDDTGVLFVSAFPGYDAFAEIITDFYKNEIRRRRLEELTGLRETALRSGGGNGTIEEINRRISTLQAELDREPYVFDRRFLFRVLSMGHSQFAEYIGARGPNTATNAACASTTQAVGLAADWIQTGRCRRVIVISADDVTSDNLMEWFGAGFLASGAAATDEKIEDAAIPFDRRRHGLLIGMGGAALVVESCEAAQERGITPICELLGTVVANSAFHGSRLDVGHICLVMEKLIAEAEARWGIRRDEIAPQTVFVSHETYTPARGGSASAEVFALRHVFKDSTNKIIVANTKGATGHPMAVGIEDVVGVKILETGIVPPVANFKEVDPELGPLNLSKGGSYPANYILRLGAGFGSQIAMTLTRWIPPPDGRRRDPGALGFAHRIADRGAWESWLRRATGNGAPELEVYRRTLRVKDLGQAARMEAEATPAPAIPQPAATAIRTQPSPQPAAAASPAALPQPVVQIQATENPVKVKVMQIVADKTGYPTDMLDLDLDLEADLGIDTVKQAEMFAAIRAAYDIPRDDNLKLRDFPTLGHTIQFVYDRRPDLMKPADGGTVAPPVLSVQVAPATAAVPAAAENPVQAKVIQIISEKTGYPPDMLDLDLDLEADLGIDTVKQAEMFAAIRAAYDIPRDDNLKLRDFPTLGHAIQFVFDRRPDLKTVGVPPAAPAAAPLPQPVRPPSPASEAPPSSAADEVRINVVRIIAEKTGYPPDMLDLDLDLEADLGIDTVKQAEMFAAIRAAYDIPRDDNLKLRDFPTLAHAIQFVFDRRPDLKPARAAAPEPPAGQPSPIAAAAGAAKAEEDPVKETVLRIIAEKTGYPIDMLDLDLDLEADLGIDTVKQAEMFASIRAAYDIPRDDNLKLRDFPTLKHTIQFVYDRVPTLSRSLQGGMPAAAATPEVEVAARTLAGSMAATEALPRRVPVPCLRPALGLCKSTGVALNAESRILVFPDQGGVGKALAGRLEKLGVRVLLVQDAPEAEILAQRIEGWKAQGPIQGVFWLPALDAEGNLETLDQTAWREAVRVRVKLLFAAMRGLYDQVTGPGSFLVSATRLGGLHGYDESGAFAPLGGAVAGFTKSFKREKPETLVKVIDFEPSRKTTAIADLIIAETLADPGAVEIGYRSDRRWTIGLEERSAADGRAGMTLGKETVFLVTGAAGSIVSAITADLAAASGGTFYLLDLAPAPDPSNSDLARFAGDKDGLKRDIFDRLKARGERATPAMVEKEMAVLERMHAALAAIEAVRRAGGTARYFSLNMLDREAVNRVMQEISSRSGRIDVLLHAAGLEISHFLPDKKPSEFDLVFDVKAEGWYNLMSNLGSMPLGSAVVFSSIAGRFGNAGQADYSSANDFLAKSVSGFRTTRPQTRGIAIDWTGWGGIGMAARGSIPQILKQAGIDLLPPEAGIPFVRRELTAGGACGEVVVAQGLGLMMREFDPEGGLELGSGGLLEGGRAGRGVMTGRITSMGLHTGLTIETELDPAKQPFLHDHQIAGTPVLPGVMGIEALAETARCLFPDLHLAGLEDVHFHAPFKFYRGQARTVTLQAQFSMDGEDVVAFCRLIGSRTLHGQTQPEITTHFTGRVRLCAQPPAAEKRDSAPQPANGRKVEAGDIYKLYFHGPAYQVLEQSWRAAESVVGLFPENLPPNHEPAGLPTLAAPRLVELCFQTAGMWEMAIKARMGLPYAIDRLRILGDPDGGKGRLFGVALPKPDGSFDAHVVDDEGGVFVVLEGYRTMEVPDSIDAALLQPLKDAIA